MSGFVNLISMSGGKDSTAMALFAIEQEHTNLRFVFADTGHEHEQTYEYVDYLDGELKRLCGQGIHRVKASFDDKIAKKREFIEKNWFADYTQGSPGKWIWRGDGDAPDMPDEPANVFVSHDAGKWHWKPARRPIPFDEAARMVREALEVLHPTGNPFLDLCLWKGRFPSTRRRFCSEELKHKPMEIYSQQLLEEFGTLVSWKGVRADESASRKSLPMYDVEYGRWTDDDDNFDPKGFLIYRPIIEWKAEDCFEQHRKFGIKHNPLYEQGMGRVGCMPCIHCNKSEIYEVARRFPNEIERVAQWELLVSKAAKRKCSTMMDARIANKHLGLPDITAENLHTLTPETHGIKTYVSWGMTSRGGRQFDLIKMAEAEEEAPMCSSVYGLCE